MLFDNDITRDREPLSCSFSNFLGRKEWIEYPVRDFFRHADAGVGNSNFRPVAGATSGYRYPALLLAILFGDRMGGVYDKIEKHLIQLADMTGYHLKGWIARKRISAFVSFFI